jgi:3-oxo-5-alpha-steroid 4-dehydrogenase 1
MDQLMQDSFETLAFAMLALAPVVFVVLLWIRAPYGRHIRSGWGPQLGNRLGWFLMELPAVLVFGFIIADYAPLTATTLLLFLLWQLHYCHRVFVYPLSLQPGRKMPWVIVLMAVLFNTINGYLNAYSITIHADMYDDSWLLQPQLIIGVVLFLSGMALNKVSDHKLAQLSSLKKRPGDYRIPYGGAYRWVSCPNYLGEIIQWTGWAIACWTLAGWVFAIWTAANLVPRAIAHHRWYQQHFDDYPRDRRALIPYLL